MLCRAPSIQLPAEWLLLHLHEACIGFMLLVDTQWTSAIDRISCHSFCGIFWHDGQQRLYNDTSEML